MSVYYPAIIPATKGLLGRIKVLWIEDELVNESEDELYQEPYEDHLVLYTASTPQDVESVLRHEYDGELRVDPSGEYAFEQTPVDVYIADLRLSKGISDVAGAGQGFDDARHASGAGLTTALLAALHHPHHPAAIVPYSARLEEAEAQLDLIRRLVPPGIILADARDTSDASGYVEKGVSAKIGTFAEAMAWFREALALSPDIIVSSSEIDRIRGIAGSCQGGSEGSLVVWPSDASMAVHYRSYGRRTMRLSSLWLDYAEALVERDAAGRATKQLTLEMVQRWLARLDRSTPEYRAAKALAWEYDRAAHSALSELRYEINDLYGTQFKSGGEPLQLVGRRKELLTAAGIPLPTDNRVPPSLQKRQLLSRREQPGTIRLALLMGLVLETWHRYCDCLRDDARATPAEVHSALQLDVLDVCRFLDPLPGGTKPAGKWEFDISLASHTKVGARLDKLEGLHPEKLIAGDGSVLRAAEIAQLERFALELSDLTRGEFRGGYPREFWPEWLRTRLM